MKALVWYPGASVSVADVAAGLHHGLNANGVETIAWHMEQAIAASGAGLGVLYDMRRKEDETTPKPTDADIFYDAAKGVLERALRYDVEWVFMVSGLYQHPDYILMLQRAGRKVALLCTEAPYQCEHELLYAAIADHVFVNERSVLERYRAVNPHTSYLPAAWHPVRHVPTTHEDDALVPAHDVVFVGTGFIERVQLLEAMDWHGINFGLYGTWEMVADDSPVLGCLPKDEHGEPVTQRGVPNPVTAALYRRALVGLNLHRTSVDYARDGAHVSGAYSLNPRCYELAATQRFFVSDFRPEVRDVFGDALPTFTTPADAEALIRKALRESAWREDVAAACYERIQAQNWTARAAQALDALDAVGVLAA